MPLVPAKCPECGGLVEVNTEKKAGICHHCGEAFIVEDAIQTFNTYYQTTNNYNTTNNYGDGAVVNIYEDENKDFVTVGGVLKIYKGESNIVVLPENVKSIASDCFLDIPIKEITINDELRDLSALLKCKTLEMIHVPTSNSYFSTKTIETDKNNVTLIRDNETKKIIWISKNSESYKLQLFDVLMEAVKKSDLYSKETNLRKINNLNIKINEYILQRNNIKKINELKKQKTAFLSRVSELETERKSLGLFSSGKKREIDDNIMSLKIKIKSTSDKIDELNKNIKRNIPNSIVSIDKEIVDLKNTIKESQNAIDNSSTFSKKYSDVINEYDFLINDPTIIKKYENNSALITSIFKCEKTRNILLNNTDVNLSKINKSSFDLTILKNKDKIRIGLPIEFGKYDNKPMLWHMIDEKDGKILLLSENSLFYVQYYWANGCGNPGWSASVPRQKLTSVYENSFSEAEKRAISNSEELYDKLFILSSREVAKYSNLPSFKTCDSACWIRTDARKQNTVDIVYSDGSINTVRAAWFYEGMSEIEYTKNGVRPAMWVDKNIFMDL